MQMEETRAIGKKGNVAVPPSSIGRSVCMIQQCFEIEIMLEKMHELQKNFEVSKCCEIKNKYASETHSFDAYLLRSTR